MGHVLLQPQLSDAATEATEPQSNMIQLGFHEGKLSELVLDNESASRLRGAGFGKATCRFDESKCIHEPATSWCCCEDIFILSIISMCKVQGPVY